MWYQQKGVGVVELEISCLQAWKNYQPWFASGNKWNYIWIVCWVSNQCVSLVQVEGLRVVQMDMTRPSSITSRMVKLCHVMSRHKWHDTIASRVDVMWRPTDVIVVIKKLLHQSTVDCKIKNSNISTNVWTVRPSNQKI